MFRQGRLGEKITVSPTTKIAEERGGSESKESQDTIDTQVEEYKIRHREDAEQRQLLSDLEKNVSYLFTTEEPLGENKETVIVDISSHFFHYLTPKLA
jgi:hypothetical protein